MWSVFFQCLLLISPGKEYTVVNKTTMALGIKHIWYGRLNHASRYSCPCLVPLTHGLDHMTYFDQQDFSKYGARWGTYNGTCPLEHYLEMSCMQCASLSYSAREKDYEVSEEWLIT